jgi:GT2 family glycosyltransferase
MFGSNNNNHLDKIAIIIPVHNRKDTTLRCLSNLAMLDKSNFNTTAIVVDDGSTDGTTHAVAQYFPETVILKGDGNLWWAGAINLGFTYALDNNYDYVYTINDDIQIQPSTLTSLYRTALTHKDTICSSICLNADQQIVYAGFIRRGGLRGFKEYMQGLEYLSYTKISAVEVDSLSTRSTLIPVKLIRRFGFLDCQHFPHNYSDIEYFHRLKTNGCLLLVDMNSCIHSQGSDTNFHRLLLHLHFKDILRTFTDIKYANNIVTLYYRSFLGNTAIIGHLAFLRTISIHAVWIILRILSGKHGFETLLKITRRL